MEEAEEVEEAGEALVESVFKKFHLDKILNMKIDFYDFGKIIIEGKEYLSDVIIYPQRVEENWWRKVGHELCIDDIKEVLEVKPEVLIVGTGYSGLMRVLPEVKKTLEEKGVELIIERTKRACEIYNQISKSKKTVACFHLTC